MSAIDADTVLIALKPYPSSLGVALEIRAQTANPVVVDLDDLNFGPKSQRLLAGSDGDVGQLGRAVARLPRTVSSPQLAMTYGGRLVPNTCSPPRIPAWHAEKPVVLFCGTPRSHKGVELLREAVAEVSSLGYELVVTGPKPKDPAPHEKWLGVVSDTQAAELRAAASLVVIPSLDVPFARHQLPQKLIHAMAAGCAVITSDLPVLRWATAGRAPAFRAGEVGDLISLLRTAVEVRERRVVGERMRETFVQRFAPNRLSGAFGDLVRQARLYDLTTAAGRLSTAI